MHIKNKCVPCSADGYNIFNILVVIGLCIVVPELQTLMVDKKSQCTIYLRLMD